MSRPFASVFRISRAIHKYLGLILILYLLGMGVTGLLLNNPALISGFSVPWAVTPANYEPRNWNRMVLRQGIIQGDHWFLAGKPGVLFSQDNGRRFTLLDEGFPRASYQRDTTGLLVRETPAGRELFAATRSGLYHRTGGKAWRQIELPGAGKRAVMDVVATSRHIVAFTYDGIYAAAIPGNADENFAVSGAGGSWDSTGGDAIRDTSGTPIDGCEADYRFMQVNAEVIDNDRSPVPWFRILHDIHNGNIIGPSGKWLLDLLAVGLIFLCISAIVIWYVPWRKRRFKRGGRRMNRLFTFCWRYHLKIGIYAAAFLVVLSVTGAFLRPPLLIAVAPHFLDRDHPLLAISPRANDWGGKLQKALYASASDTLLLAAEGGFFRGPADFSAPFEPFSLPAPVHGMGVTVLEEAEPGLILIGSFMGLYLWEEGSGRVRRLPRIGLRGGHPYMSNDLVCGLIMSDGRPRFRVDYHDGLMPLFHPIGHAIPPMPSDIVRKTPMSLWHYVFEFHNGRIFEKWLGPGYMLIIPLAGIGLLLSAITGITDWFYRRK